MHLQCPSPPPHHCALVCIPRQARGVQTAPLDELKMGYALQENMECTLAADKYLSCTARLELAQCTFSAGIKSSVLFGSTDIHLLGLVLTLVQCGHILCL